MSRMTLEQLFASREAFENRFIDGLHALITTDRTTPAHVVLAITNACATEDLGLFAAAMAAIPGALAQPPNPADPDDEADRAILRQVSAELTSPVGVIKHRLTPAGRSVVYSPMRLWRPPRAAAAPSDHVSMHRPFDPGAFSFQRLPVEFMAEVDTLGLTVRFYYNKYPSGPWHLSVVPEVASGYPQWLTREFLELAVTVRRAAKVLPGVLLIYNSLLGRASINEFHLQLMVAPDLRLSHGLVGTGTVVPEFRDAGDGWQLADAYQSESNPLHLLLTDTYFIVPRLPQGPADKPEWSYGFAGMELAGYILVTSLRFWLSLTDEQYLDVCRQIVCPVHSAH